MINPWMIDKFMIGKLIFNHKCLSSGEIGIKTLKK